MSKGQITHLFPGGNTSQGFFSYYNYILEQEEATRIFCIKGGPGVGKSTFMKKICSEMVDLGYDVEQMHCSSDNNSLDGVVIPSIKVALLDGTAPHVVDPKNPGAVDEIIHLGDFWDEAGIRKNKKEIIECNKEVGRTFARAYKYINAAYAIYKDNIEIVKLCIDKGKTNSEISKVINDLFKNDALAPNPGKDRKLFGSAITPNGLVNYLPTVLKTDTVYVLNGLPGTGTEDMLQRIKSSALERGYNVLSLYCALDPLKLEHLIIKGKNVSFTTSNKYHNVNTQNSNEINYNDLLDTNIMNKYNDVMDFNNNKFEELLNQAIKTISSAKSLHDQMENYYIPNMDFDSIQLCRESITARIFDYANEFK